MNSRPATIPPQAAVRGLRPYTVDEADCPGGFEVIRRLLLPEGAESSAMPLLLGRALRAFAYGYCGVHEITGQLISSLFSRGGSVQPD